MIFVCEGSGGFDVPLGFCVIALLLQQAAQLRVDLESGRIGRLIRRCQVELEELDGKLWLLMAAAKNAGSIYQRGPMRLGCLGIGIDPCV